MEITVKESSTNRLDLFLVEYFDDFSRSKIQNLIKSGAILLNHQPAKAKSSLSIDDVISINLPDEAPSEPQPEDIPLSVLFEDDDLIVLNKSEGMVVHPAAGNQSGTLVNALLHHCGGKLASEGGEGRPGIVHRLDKDTSGCIVVAKTNTALVHLVEQFKARTTKKQYLTVVQGKPAKDNDSIFTSIGRHPVNRMKMAVVDPGSGKSAITDYHILHHNPENNTSYIHCDLHTGRTHQIRVHMLHIGCPILGDPLYANIKRQKAQTGRLMLHARVLEIDHPMSGERLHFEAPLPPEYTPWIIEK